MVPECSLSCLSTEILLKIFIYLNVRDLCRLKCTCTRFDEIIKAWDHVLLKHITTITVSNQRSEKMLIRSTKLPALERIRISRNWMRGSYKEKSMLYTRRKYMPWLCLDKDFIWLSRGNKIYNFRRYGRTVHAQRPVYALSGKSEADIVRFVYKNNVLVSGQRDGSIWLWSMSEETVLFGYENCHDSDINCVDITQSGEIIVSGSRDNFLKIWRRQLETDSMEGCYIELLRDRVCSVSLLDEKPLVAVGTAGIEDSNGIFVYDLERLVDLHGFPCNQTGSGVLDLKWDSPNVLWSCGYDACVRRWDLRTGACEQTLQDPHGSVLYCLDCDYYNTVIVGCQMHGRVALWDTRQTRCVQLYFMKSCADRSRGRSSPVYSLAFDAAHLFTATDQNLNVLDFSIYNGPMKDYTYFL